jgi:hypothetical protein
MAPCLQRCKLAASREIQLFSVTLSNRAQWHDDVEDDSLSHQHHWRSSSTLPHWQHWRAIFPESLIQKKPGK